MRIHGPNGCVPLLCAAVLAAFTVSACASAPINMMRAEEGAGAPLEAQTRLRDEGAALARLVDAEGWRLVPTAGDQARSFLGRLIGGAEADAAAPDPVEAYLQAHAPGGVAADLSTLGRRARRVSLEARAVADASRPLTQASLQRDIAAAETALGAVRGAYAFFLEAAERLDAPDGDVAGRLADLKSAETALAEAADALAARRWARDGGALTG